MNSTSLWSRALFWALVGTLHFSSPVFSQALSGNYTIGEASDFPTVASAIHKLDSFGVKAPVVFNIRSGIYFESDTIRPIKGSSATNTITFQSESGDSSSVVIEWNSEKSGDWNLRLERAGYITFRDVCFRQTYDGARSNVILIRAHNIRFENCLFEGSNMVMDGCLLSGSADSNITIASCHFRYARQGVDLSSNGFLSGLSIISSVFHTQNRGARLRRVKELHVAGNHISNISGGPYVGLLIHNCKALDVNRNHIRLKAGGPGSRAMDLENISGERVTPAMVDNNLIDVEADNQKGIVGLRIGDLNHVLIAHNNIRLDSRSPHHSAIAFVPTAGGIDNSLLVNNIIANEGPGYALKFDKPWLSHLLMDHNLWYTAGSELAPGQSSPEEIMVYYDHNRHSQFTDPLFTMDDLRAKTPLLDSTALPIPQLSLDYEGKVRNKLFPDIGAFERLAPPEVELGTHIVACEFVDLTVNSNADRYDWSNGAHGDSIRVYQSGTYWVKAYNGDGVSSDSVQVQILNSPKVRLSAYPIDLSPGDCAILRSHYRDEQDVQLIWRDDQGVILGQNTVQVCPSILPATYTLEVLYGTGCKSLKNITLYPERRSDLTALRNDSTQNQRKNSNANTPTASIDLVLFPNPGLNKILVQLSSPVQSEVSMSLSDLAGQKIPLKYQSRGTGQFELDISDLAAGSYILSVTSGQHSYQRRLIKAAK